MPNQTINQLTALAGEAIDRTSDQFVLWDADATTSKKVAASEVVTTGEVDPGSTSQVTGLVNKIVSCNQATYNLIAAGTPDPATLYVITDGKTKDSYVGHIETPADGTYYLDPKVAEAREITGVYFAWTAGGSPDGDIDVQIGGTSVLSSTGRMNSGSSFTGTLKTDGTEDVAADAVITVVLGTVNGVADVTDLRFSVEYAQ
jgi:hypothetical protein